MGVFSKRTFKNLYSSNKAFKFDAIVLEYTSSPNHDRCSTVEATSRFQGLEHTTAALSRQSEPSSPRYYPKNEY